MYYILEGKKPKQIDFMEWAKFMRGPRHVGETFLNGHVRVRISTVFLGLDHSWHGGPPLLFETMIFGIKQNEYQTRYATWEEAEKGHRYAVNIAKSYVEWMQKVIKISKRNAPKKKKNPMSFRLRFMKSARTFLREEKRLKNKIRSN